ncbi:MAG: hypothetical protein ABSB74_05090 [Tepidisphaeraceae bacterium]
MRHAWIGLAIIVSAAVPLRAQTTPSDAKSAPTPAENMLNEMLKPAPAATAPATRPADVQAMRPEGYTPPVAPPQLLREGSDVIARRGYLQKLPDGPYSQIAFVDDPSQPKLAPMLVLPNLQLMSMEDAGSATRQNLIFAVSGTTTEYKGKNYILLEPGPEDVSRQIPQLDMPPASQQGPVSADQMLSDMLAASSQPAGLPPPSAEPSADRASGSGALPPKAPLVNVLRERSQVFDRVARLSRSPDGIQEQITLESDGTALQDPPLILLPNLKLVALEGAAADRDARFRVTGMVTEYRGRNYILLQKVVVMSDSDRQF